MSKTTACLLTIFTMAIFLQRKFFKPNGTFSLKISALAIHHTHTLQVPIQLSRETDFPLCTEPGSVQKAVQLCETAVRNKADNAL